VNVQFHKKYFYTVLVIAILAIILLPREMKAYVPTIFPLITFAPYGFMAVIKRFLLDNYLISNHYDKLKELKVEIYTLGYERIGPFEYSYKKKELSNISDYVGKEILNIEEFLRIAMLSFFLFIPLSL
jgi:hypothetical protein